MKTYFVTGTSQGLGLALAQNLLNTGNIVYGIGRNHSLEHSNYFRLNLDMSIQSEVKKFVFPDVQSTKIVLINNAGMIGEIDRFSVKTESDFDLVMQVNVNALVELCHTFLKQFSIQDLSIVNISSGAGKRPIASWLSYCTSKAAVDMVSQVLLEEEKELGKKTKIYALSPGVIDTNMQSQIRSSDSTKFSSHQNFKNLQEKGELLSPQTVAEKILKLISLKYNGKVLCSIADLDSK